MASYVKSSLLDDFEIPEVSYEAIKANLVKINKSHTVKKNSNFSSLPLTEKLKIIESEVYKVLGRYKGYVKVIYDIETLNKYIDKAISVDYLAFDTETNNSLDPLTCKLMGLCLYIPNTKPVYVPINHCKPGTEELLPNQVTEEQARDALMRLKDTKLVYHNGKFDIRVIYNTLGFYLPIWWDTMLAAQLINEDDLAKLKFQFKKYIDPTIGTYNIEKLFAGIPYAWVNPEIFALYAAIDSYDTYKLQKYQEKILDDVDMHKVKNLLLNIEVPVTSIVAKMEDVGITLDMDFVNKLNTKYHNGLDKAVKDLEELLKPYEHDIQAYQLSNKLDDPLNFNSPPQLQIIMYDILKYDFDEEEGKATDKETLVKLNTPFTNALLDYRHYSKMITAFTEALPELRSKKDGKIHASFNQMGKEENNVRTGRFSSTNPNLQQIPSREKMMRLMFKGSPGYAIVGADYSAQEPRLMTHLSGDPVLTQTFLDKKDPYATIMSKVRHMDYWDCMEHHQDGTKNPEGAKIRKVAKQLMLGILYGMGPNLMAQNLKITVDECKQILDDFFKTFPKVKEFTLQNEQHAREFGYVEDYLGRRRHLEDINLPELEIKAKRNVIINNTTLDDLESVLRIDDEDETKRWNNLYNEKFKGKGFKKKAEFKQLASQSNVDVRDNGAFISRTMTQCTNATIQGSAASLTKKAMVTIYNNKELMDLGFRLLVPIHDELLGECPIENAERCEQLLAESMINAAKPECSVAMNTDTYLVKHWYADEVSASICDTYNRLVRDKDNPISEEEALNKLISKYSELLPETVKSMCLGTFDCLTDSI